MNLSNNLEDPGFIKFANALEAEMFEYAGKLSREISSSKDQTTLLENAIKMNREDCIPLLLKGVDEDMIVIAIQSLIYHSGNFQIFQILVSKMKKVKNYLHLLKYSTRVEYKRYDIALELLKKVKYINSVDMNILIGNMIDCVAPIELWKFLVEERDAFIDREFVDKTVDRGLVQYAFDKVIKSKGVEDTVEIYEILGLLIDEFKAYDENSLICRLIQVGDVKSVCVLLSTRATSYKVSDVLAYIVDKGYACREEWRNVEMFEDETFDGYMDPYGDNHERWIYTNGEFKMLGYDSE